MLQTVRKTMTMMLMTNGLKPAVDIIAQHNHHHENLKENERTTSKISGASRRRFST